MTRSRRPLAALTLAALGSFVLALACGQAETEPAADCGAELPEGWPYAVPLRPRHVLRDIRDGLPLAEAMTIGGERIRRFARGACARGLYRIGAPTFARIEEALAPRAASVAFQTIIEASSKEVSGALR